jgi:hypothetical protein
MHPGEFAVHVSGGLNASTCAIFQSLPDAEQYARQEVQQHPTMKCRVFDHHGFVGAPALEIVGSDSTTRDEITPRFRRWIGSVLFFGGSILFVTDWVANFRFDWPSVLGSRLMIPGLILLVTEALVMHHKRRSQRHDNRAHL